MQPVTPVVLPQSTPFVQDAVAAMPQTQLVLDEVGALYPVVAYWSEEESESNDETDAEAHMNEEALDELIFASMVSSH
jgi:hypothetical protein